MNFWNKLFRVNREKIDKKAYEMGYKDGLRAGVRVGKKEGEASGWKKAMSTIGNFVDEMIIKKD